jgi:signal transduction histidine kinase
MQAIKHPEHELELALEHGHYEEEGWRIRKDGSRFWASVLITAVYDSDRTHVGFAKVTRDIQERREMLSQAEDSAVALASANYDLASANTRLAREAADQAQFLAVTAHELRTPISVLAGSATLLVQHLDDLEPEERKDLADSMVSSAERLQRLLSDLLTAARLESKAVRMQFSEVDVAELLGQRITSVRAAAPNADIHLDVQPGMRVTADADRIAQAIDNLINNALRHGAPPVDISAAERPPYVDIRVTDSGPGVPPSVRDRLFDRFATGSARSGTGLGLFIVRELARAHGGEAWYEHNAGERPSFVLALRKQAQLPG